MIAALVYNDMDEKMVGREVSRYRIIERIGAGGMGVVYRAEDKILKRDVALKFLPAGLTADSEARERLVREAQVASALDHPSICTVYEIDQAPDGQMYMAMAYYPGQTLKQRIEQGPIPVEESLEISLEIAKGLIKAHEKGVIHRDIKPANIIITEDDFIKIVDFGLAILTGQTHITSEQVIAVGTVNYMSPEQLQGEEVDRRTDVWALGLVMFEMLTGVYPFRGTNAPSVMHSIMHDDPGEFVYENRLIPGPFKTIIEKCLKKNAGDRYPDMTRLLEDLTGLGKGERWDPGDQAKTGYKKIPSIAVLPFENLSPDREQDYLCDGMADEIIHTLGHVPGVRVLARASVFSFKGQKIDIKKIGRQLGVSRILQGTLQSSGGRLRIFVNLIGIPDGYSLWSERYDRKNEDLLSIQDDISRTIVENLKGRLLEDGQELPVLPATRNIEAYHHFLQGYYFLNKRSREGLKKGMEYFRQAIGLDPFYAPAQVGLADAHILFAGYEMMPPVQAYPLARQAVDAALKLDGSLAWAHAMRATILWEDSRDPVAAGQEFRFAIDLAPGMSELHHVYAEFLSCLGRFEPALTEINLALELDPLSLLSHVLKGFIYYLMGDTDRAVRHYRSVIEKDPAFITANCEMGMALVQAGNYPAGIRALDRTLELSNSNPMYLSRLGYGLGKSGDRARSRGILKKLKDLAKNTYVSPFSLAVIYLGLGDRENAIDCLQTAFDEKIYHLLFLKTDPLFDPVRSDPRIQKMLKKMGFAED